jgi:hypothetical protein
VKILTRWILDEDERALVGEKRLGNLEIRRKWDLVELTLLRDCRSTLRGWAAEAERQLREAKVREL